MDFAPGTLDGMAERLCAALAGSPSPLEREVVDLLTAQGNQDPAARLLRLSSQVDRKRRLVANGTSEIGAAGYHGFALLFYRQAQSAADPGEALAWANSAFRCLEAAPAPVEPLAEALEALVHARIPR